MGAEKVAGSDDVDGNEGERALKKTSSGSDMTQVDDVMKLLLCHG